MMTTNGSFLKKHPVLIYFVLTFAISWGGVLLIIGGRSAIPATREQYEALAPMVFPTLLIGPCIAGLLMTGLVYGRAGYRELFSRLLKWRVGIRWYGVALLTTPVLATANLLVLSLFSAEFLPVLFTTDDKIALLVTGIMTGLLGGGIFEELGWTGFAIPRLRLRYGVLTTGLIVGILWGVWHFIVHLWAIRAYSGEVPLALFLPLFLSAGAVQLMAYRMLMVWVYERTGRSLLVAMLMHTSHTASTVFILMPVVATGVTLLIYAFVLAAALWIVVAAVATANRRQISRQPLQRRVA